MSDWWDGVARSELCTFDVSNGETEVVLATTAHIEAPNWTPDGASLIVNGQGRLWRVPLAAPDLHPIDTGFATRLNNDHGLSPDGRSIFISDKTETGESCIYRIPEGGGTPQRLTDAVPSWWHGVSPDGARIVYTAMRNHAFVIATSQTDGQEEVIVAEGFDHLDGPDYTRDGRHIWFNAETSGTSDLWRTSNVGGAPKRMTDDDRVNWFPHPSPDGRHVVYLAYPPGTRGHPGGLQVELRIMPQAGGTPRTLLELFGGQGTINVPSWSPDARRFAFVRYVPQ